MLWFRCVCILFILGWGIVGCGRADVPVRAAAPPPQVQATTTPTGPELDATQQADDARIEAERATALAEPTPATLVLPATAPAQPPQIGILASCDSLYGDQYYFTNCWNGLFDEQAQWLFFVAGTKTKGDTQGLVGFFRSDSNTGTNSEFFEYPTPNATGAVTITEVTLPRFTLVSATGVTYIFNVDTRQWEDAGSTPVPTPGAVKG